MEDKTSLFAPEDIAASKSLAWLSYLGIFLLIPLLVNKDSAFTKFHVNQGLVLLIGGIIASAIAAIPFIGFVGVVLQIIIGVFGIMGIVYSATGKAKTLPLIGSFVLIK